MITTLIATGALDAASGTPAIFPVAIEEARLQCSLAVDDNSEDYLLNAYMLAARTAAMKKTGISLLAGAIIPPTDEELAVFKAAMLMMIAHWFNNREAATGDTKVVPTEMPLSSTWLLGTIKRRVL